METGRGEGVQEIILCLSSGKKSKRHKMLLDDAMKKVSQFPTDIAIAERWGLQSCQLCVSVCNAADATDFLAGFPFLLHFCSLNDRSQTPTNKKIAKQSRQFSCWGTWAARKLQPVRNCRKKWASFAGIDWISIVLNCWQILNLARHIENVAVQLDVLQTDFPG